MASGGSLSDSLFGIAAAALGVSLGLAVTRSAPAAAPSGTHSGQSGSEPGQSGNASADGPGRGRGGTSEHGSGIGLAPAVALAVGAIGVVGVAYCTHRYRGRPVRCECCGMLGTVSRDEGDAEQGRSSYCTNCKYSPVDGHRVLRRGGGRARPAHAVLARRDDALPTAATVWHIHPVALGEPPNISSSPTLAWEFMQREKGLPEEPLYDLPAKLVQNPFYAIKLGLTAHARRSNTTAAGNAHRSASLSDTDRMRVLRAVEPPVRKILYVCEVILKSHRAYLLKTLLKHAQTPLLSVNRRSTAERRGLLSHSFWWIMHSEWFRQPVHLWRKFEVRFEPHELGSDYGGLTKEWFRILGRDLFAKADYGLFRPSPRGGCLEVHPDSRLVHGDEALMYYRFAGRIIGMALISGHVMPECKLGRHVWKMFTARGMSFDDIRSIDPEIHKSLQQLLRVSDASLCDITGHDFRRVTMLGKEVAVLPDGPEHQITNENRDGYVGRLVYALLIGQCEDQLKHMMSGLCDVVRPEILALLEPEEMQGIICGDPEPLDVAQWKEHTVVLTGESYMTEAADDDALVDCFWSAVAELSQDDRRRLLQFWTGSSATPMGGFAAFGHTGSSRPRKLTLKLCEGDALPTAATCFNVLKLPRGAGGGGGGVTRMRRMLRVVVENSEGFGVV